MSTPLDSIPRRAATQVAAALARSPAVVLTGPRQTGKTTLARAIAAKYPDSVYLDCERPADLARLANAELALIPLASRLVVMDEVQRAPWIFPLLRGLVDADRRPGRFLLLGSASPQLIGMSAESLAGRATVIELAPFDVAEVDPAIQPSLWLRGGFPLSLLAKTDADSLAWRQDFIQLFLERDLPQLGIGVSAQQMRRFWLMLAHHHGQTWNASQFASAFGMTHTTMQRYLGFLEQAGVMRVLPPFAANLKKRLVKAPRAYLRDSGLLHALLDIPDRHALLGQAIAGASWEGFVIEQICRLAPPGAAISYFRTAAGAEMDLVVEKGTRRFAFEVKLSTAPAVSRGFWNALEDLKPEHAFVVAPVDAHFPLANGVDAIAPSMLPSLFAG